MNTSTASNPLANARFTRRGRQWLTALVFAAALVGPTLAAETSMRHEYMMRGQVLESLPGSVVICIGKQDGAEVGQILNVARHVRGSNHDKSAQPRYRREDIGKVKIATLFDDHYATATIVKGSPKVNDVVELDR